MLGSLVIEAMKMYMPIPVSNIVTFVITAGGIVVVNGIMGRIVGYVRDDNTVYDPAKAMELLKATKIEIKDERPQEERKADDMEKAAVALAYSTEETATMPVAIAPVAAAPIPAMPIIAIPQTRAAAAGGAGDYHAPTNSSNNGDGYSIAEFLLGMVGLSGNYEDNSYCSVQ